MKDMGALQQKLAATRQWWRTTRILSGLAWTVSVVIVLALVCYHADSRLVLSPTAREGWRLGILLAGLGTLLAGLLLALLRRLPDSVVAADVERHYPILKERLLTTVDLVPSLATSGADLPSGFSRSMALSLAEETQRTAVGLNFRRAVDTRPLRRGALVAGVMLALLLLQVALAPDAFANWLRRMKDTRGDIPVWANTLVYVRPDAEILPRGEGVWVSVVTRGAPTDRCVLRYRPEDQKTGVWKTVELNRPETISENLASTDGARPAQTHLAGEKTGAPQALRFRYHFASLPQSLAMYATANDGRSNERAVRVEDRPTLQNVRLTFHYPAYTHKAAETLTVSTADIAALVGTEVEIQGHANKPLRAAECVLNNTTSSRWTINGDRVNGQMPVWKDGAYTLDLTDRHGFANRPPLHYEIHALKDQTPTVQIQRPSTDVDLVPDGSVPLVAHSVDDYGVESMHLVFDKLHGDSAHAGEAGMQHTGHGVLALPGPTGAPQAHVSQRWHVGSVNPNVGDTVRYEVTATDNDTISGPHTGHSTTYRIHVVSLVEMQQRLKEGLDDEARAVAQLRQQQIAAQHDLEQARQQMAAAMASRSQEKARTAANAVSHAQETERAVAQQAKAVAQRVGDLSAQLENNNLATPSELQRRAAAEQTLQNVSQQKAPAAADTVQRAQTPKPDASHAQPLAQADRQESDIKHDIEQAQQMLSRIPPPEQLAAEAARLAKEQQDRADMVRTLAEDIRQNGSKTLTPEEQTGLEMERRNQAALNQDTQRLQQQLQQAAKAAQERGNSQQAQALRQAAQALQQGKATQHQQQAQQSLQSQNPGKAAPEQDRAAAALEQAARAAQKAADPQSSSEATIDKLEQTAQQLRDLAKQQHDVAGKIGQNPDAQQSRQLGQQERSIQNQAGQAQQNLNASPNAQQSLQRAQQNLGKSGQQLSQNRPQSAQSPAQNAAQQLENAAKQAENAAQQLRQQQAAAELADRVEHLAQVQHALQNTTQRLQNTTRQRPLNNNEERELNQAAQRQENVEEETKDLADRFPSPAFKQALGMAAHQMHPATQNLNQRNPDTGSQTQSAQGRAAQTLDTVAQALKQQAQGSPQNGQQQQQQSGQQGDMNAQQAQQAAALGDLLLARGLQQQVRQDTGALDQARHNQPLTQQQQEQNQQITQDQRTTQDITQRAGQDLESLPGVQDAIRQATQHMEQAGNGLEQQQTGQPTQNHQDQAIQHLDQAAKQAQQAQQQQQQQQQAQANAQQGAPQPSQQKGNDPNRVPFTRLEKAQQGPTQSPDQRAGHFGALTPRAQRTLREGQQEKVSAEYQDLVKRYFSALGEKKR